MNTALANHLSLSIIIFMSNVIYQLDPSDMSFPNPELAITSPDGLLAIGGDLSITRLHNAYACGIFPWFNEGEPYYWWSPSTRAVLEPTQFEIHRSFSKFLRKQNFKVTVNKAFPEVITECAIRNNGEDTWITDEMQTAYCNLHSVGLAHSIEVWDVSADEQLVAGLYGVAIGQLFCGESMFHRVSNTSKLALYALCCWWHEMGGKLIDCQMPTEHLATLGVQPCSRQEYLKFLYQLRNEVLPLNVRDETVPLLSPVDYKQLQAITTKLRT